MLRSACLAVLASSFVLPGCGGGSARGPSPDAPAPTSATSGTIESLGWDTSHPLYSRLLSPSVPVAQRILPFEEGQRVDQSLPRSTHHSRTSYSLSCPPPDGPLPEGMSLLARSAYLWGQAPRTYDSLCEYRAEAPGPDSQTLRLVEPFYIRVNPAPVGRLVFAPFTYPPAKEFQQGIQNLPQRLPRARYSDGTFPSVPPVYSFQTSPGCSAKPDGVTLVQPATPRDFPLLHVGRSAALLTGEHTFCLHASPGRDSSDSPVLTPYPFSFRIVGRSGVYFRGETLGPGPASFSYHNDPENDDESHISNFEIASGSVRFTFPVAFVDAASRAHSPAPEYFIDPAVPHYRFAPGLIDPRGSSFDRPPTLTLDRIIYPSTETTLGRYFLYAVRFGSAGDAYLTGLCVRFTDLVESLPPGSGTRTVPGSGSGDAEPTTETYTYDRWSRTLALAFGYAHVQTSDGTFDCSRVVFGDDPVTQPSPGDIGTGPVNSALLPEHARAIFSPVHEAVSARARDGSGVGWSVTPAVEWSSRSGVSGPFRYDGTSRQYRFMVDYAVPDAGWGLGAVVAHTDSDLRYDRVPDDEYTHGRYDLDVISVSPYARAAFDAWGRETTAFASVSAAQGRVSHEDVGARSGFPGLREPRATGYAAALGASHALPFDSLSVEGLFETTRMHIHPIPNKVRDVSTRTADATTAVRWTPLLDSVFAPTAHLGMRWLGGDGATGREAVAGAGLSARGALSGRLSGSLGFEHAQGQGASDRRATGLSGSLSYRHRPDSALGAGWNVEASGRSADDADAVLGMRLGLGLPGERSVIEPFVRVRSVPYASGEAALYGVERRFPGGSLWVESGGATVDSGLRLEF